MILVVLSCNQGLFGVWMWTGALILSVVAWFGVMREVSVRFLRVIYVGKNP